ncbi:MAG TPA: NAD(P)H-hydrate epimerase, partial [Chloroflexota bacterium]|nr:NAD(P)H-hydrate epimerase [Chloroflexota bacterium]
RLHNYGADVRVFTTKLDVDFTATSTSLSAGVPAHQLDILRRMDVPVALAEEMAAEGNTATSTTDAASALSAGVLIIDGLIGYSLQGSPRGSAAQLIRWANRQAVPILALDTPSGLDTTTGAIYEPAIRAAATMTLALPKVGLLANTAAPYVGELYLADIGVPPSLYAGPALQLTVGPIFAASDIVRLRQERSPTFHKS